MNEALGRQDVPDLAGADPKCERAKRPVGAGVAIAADHGRSRLRQSQLGCNHVDDSLPLAAQTMKLDSELAAVGFDLSDLGGGLRVNEGELAVGPAGGRHRMIDGGDGALGPAHAKAALAQHVECLRRGDLVDEVEVHIEHRGRLRRLGRDEVRIPDLLEERARRRPGRGLPPVSNGPSPGPGRLAGGDNPIDHLQIGSSAGEDDVRAHPLPPVGALIVLDLDRNLALGIAANGGTRNLIVAQLKAHARNLLDRLEDRIHRTVPAGGALFRPTVALAKRDAGRGHAVGSG